MTNHIDKLQEEHAQFAKLLDLLEAQIGLFHHGEQPDYDLMLEIFYYMTHYPDRFHHPKEDLAFARLAERDPDIRGKVEELARLHRVIARSGSRFLKKLDVALAGAMLSRESVEIPAFEYITLYRNHMKLDADEDSLFGRTVEDRYRRSPPANRAHGELRFPGRLTAAGFQRILPIGGTATERRRRIPAEDIMMEASHWAGVRGKLQQLKRTKRPSS